MATVHSVVGLLLDWTGVVDELGRVERWKELGESAETSFGTLHVKTRQG